MIAPMGQNAFQCYQFFSRCFNDFKGLKTHKGISRRKIREWPFLEPNKGFHLCARSTKSKSPIRGNLGDQLPISLYTRQKRKESHFILQECTYLFDKYSKYSYVFFRVE